MPDDAAISAAVKTALDAYVDPYLGETLGSRAGRAGRRIVAAGGSPSQIHLGFPVGGYRG